MLAHVDRFRVKRNRDKPNIQMQGKERNLSFFFEKKVYLYHYIKS